MKRFIIGFIIGLIIGYVIWSLAIFLVKLTKPKQQQPIKNYIEIAKAKTEPLRDSINVYKYLIDSLKKAKRGVKIVPYSVLIKDTVYLDSACNIVAKKLLNQVAKRDSVILLDSNIIVRQDKEIVAYQKMDSVNTSIIKDCQTENAELNKKTVKAESKAKKNKIIASIVSIIAIFAWLL